MDTFARCLIISHDFASLIKSAASMKTLSVRTKKVRLQKWGAKLRRYKVSKYFFPLN